MSSFSFEQYIGRILFSQLEAIRLEHYFLIIHIFRLRYGFQFVSNGFTYNELRSVSTGISSPVQYNGVSTGLQFLSNGLQ